MIGKIKNGIVVGLHILMIVILSINTLVAYLFYYDSVPIIDKTVPLKSEVMGYMVNNKITTIFLSAIIMVFIAILLRKNSVYGIIAGFLLLPLNIQHIVSSFYDKALFISFILAMCVSFVLTFILYKRKFFTMILYILLLLFIISNIVFMFYSNGTITIESENLVASFEVSPFPFLCVIQAFVSFGLIILLYDARIPSKIRRYIGLFFPSLMICLNFIASGVIYKTILTKNIIGFLLFYIVYILIVIFNEKWQEDRPCVQSAEMLNII